MSRIRGALDDPLLSVVMPAFNESATIEEIVRRVMAVPVRTQLIVVDDAHTLAFGSLDALRYIHDQTAVGMVLVGIPSLARHLSSKSEEYEQIASRVAGRVHELPEFGLSDARLMIDAVMPERDVERAMALLKSDPQTLASGRRLGNLLEDAGKFAKRRDGTMTLEDVQKAMRLAA